MGKKSSGHSVAGAPLGSGRGSTQGSGVGAGVLERLGFTPLESVIYAFLVKAGPATGYRIAQAVGKPVGNVYKAVEGLEDKGAVMTSEEDATRLVRAVGVREVISRLRSEVCEACEEAVERLEAGAVEVVDDHVYRIAHTGQFLRRAGAMLESATRFVILTATPGVLASKSGGRDGSEGDGGGGEETLAGMIARASGRIRVACKVFEPVLLGRAEVVVDPRGAGAV
ncbi:MAG TPA: helix-turn-helix domain-containing protein, partial [Phycisphaerales bacterium]|nr:helix-turn-helix domain-containing protein [Phycisphaerales bacterium]